MLSRTMMAIITVMPITEAVYKIRRLATAQARNLINIRHIQAVMNHTRGWMPTSHSWPQETSAVPSIFASSEA